MTALRLRPLAERAEWVDTLARWHHAEWGALYGGAWTFEAARDELAGHARHGGCPGTWVAELDGKLIGSVSVVEEDADSLRDLGSPWLASLYVRPEARGSGIGRQLVQRAEQEARASGFQRLWLFTPRHADWYAALGWQSVGTSQVNGAAVSVMRRELVRPA